LDLVRLIEAFKKNEWIAPRISHIELIDKKDASYSEINNDYPDKIASYLKNRGIKLYSHQYKVLKGVRNGENVIITTPTASGKTLAFNIPIFERLNEQKDAKALYIYPTKALTNDQLKVVKEMEEGTEIKVNPAVYDGDTPRSKRVAIRKSSRIILSNPFEIHEILPWHQKWGAFFSNLSFIVLDEAHTYRGVFGSNVALLIRRLLRICSLYGSSPQIIISSATLANPEEFANKLTGLDFTLVNEDGSPRGRKYFVLYNPYFSGIGALSTYEETKNLFILLIENGLQTLCFTTSRKMAEVITMLTKRDLMKHAPELADKVSSYRAGYLPEERRKIENKLKNSELIGVVSTNALEVGIDVGSLDAVIISGYPGTVISTWQQAGRSGRGMDDSLAILVAFQNPLDQYIMRHPDEFFKKAHEYAIIDVNNPYILSSHIMCAASEFPVKESVDEAYFGKEFSNHLKALSDIGLVNSTDSGWVYSGSGRATEKARLDSISSEVYKVVADGRILETMNKTQAFREAHPGAVLIHLGETYVVSELSLENRTAYADKEDVDYYTNVIENADVKIIEKIKEKRINKNLKVTFGNVSANEFYLGYYVKMYDKIIGSYELDLPPINFDTTSIWFEISDEIKDNLRKKLGEDAFMGGLHGIEHAMIGIMPFYIMCDRWDLGGLSTNLSQETGKATIFVYDAFEGGIGLSEKTYEIFEEVLEATYKLIKDCPCEEENGCPACIHSPKCGNENETLNKLGAIKILEAILS